MTGEPGLAWLGLTTTVPTPPRATVSALGVTADGGVEGARVGLDITRVGL